MKLIVGLGNPGKEYEKTRHNIGFMILDKYLGNVKWSKKFNGEYYETNINGEKYINVTFPFNADHLLLNALSVITVCYLEKLDKEVVKEQIFSIVFKE